MQELAELVDLLLIRNDYLEATRILEEIPEYQRTQRLRELLGDAYGLKSNVEKLEAKLEAALNQIDLPVLKKCVADLLKIHPSHPRAKEIKRALNDGGKKGIVKFLKASGHYHGGGLAWEWWQVAAAIGTIGTIFGATLFAVIIYINNSKQTVQIEIDDPTAVIKIDGQVVDIKGASTGEVRLTIGQHEYTAQVGDTEIRSTAIVRDRNERPDVRIDADPSRRSGREATGAAQKRFPPNLGSAWTWNS